MKVNLTYGLCYLISVIIDKEIVCKTCYVQIRIIIYAWSCKDDVQCG